MAPLPYSRCPPRSAADPPGSRDRFPGRPFWPRPPEGWPRLLSAPGWPCHRARAAEWCSVWPGSDVCKDGSLITPDSDQWVVFILTNQRPTLTSCWSGRADRRLTSRLWRRVRPWEPWGWGPGGPWCHHEEGCPEHRYIITEVFVGSTARLWQLICNHPTPTALKSLVLGYVI